MEFQKSPLFKSRIILIQHMDMKLLEKSSTTLQNKILTQSEKKTSIVKVRNVDKATENLAGSSKQRRTENMTSANADPEIDANPVRAKSAENYPAQNHQVPECNRIRVSEPVTEERFLTYFKCLNTKLNHIINLLKDRCTEMLVDEAENLLPNFPLRTVQEFEQFQKNLVTSLEIQKLYIRGIKMVGGSDPDKFTRATLHFLISNELALQYS